MKSKVLKRRRSVMPDRGKPPLSIKYISPPNTFPIKVEVTMHIETDAHIRSIVAGEPLTLLPAEGVNLLARAEAGDCGPLIEYFATGGELTADERRIMAALARGDYPKPDHRAGAVDTEVFAKDVALFMAALKLAGGTRVPDIAAEKFKIDRTTASKHFKRFRAEGWSAVIIKQLYSIYGADPATAQRLMLRFAGITDDDMHRAMARKPRRSPVRKRGK
jgi:hypothetical protein